MGKEMEIAAGMASGMADGRGMRDRRAVSDDENLTPHDTYMWPRGRRRRRPRLRHEGFDCGGQCLAGGVDVAALLRQHALLLCFLACCSCCLTLPHLRLERTLLGRGVEARAGGGGGEGRSRGGVQQRECRTRLPMQGSSSVLSEGGHFIMGIPKRSSIVQVLRQRGGMEEGVVDGETATTLTDPAYTQVKDFMALERINSFGDDVEGSESGNSKSRVKKSTMLGLTRVHLGSKYAWFYPDPPWGRKDIHRSGSKFLRYWHALVWVTMAYIAIILPMRAAGFGAPSVGGDCSTLGLSWVDVIADSVFLTDMLFSSKTAYYMKSGGGHLQLVDDLESIQKHYVRSKAFLCDVLGIVPLHEIYCLSERLLQWTRPRRSGPFRPAIAQARKFIGLFKMLRMVKLFRLHHFRHMWRFLNGIFPNSSRVLHLAKLLIMLLFTGHILACGWYFVGNLSPESWIERSRELMKSDHWFAHYVTSFYFVYATMTTVGYGDINAVTVAERAFCVIAMVVGGFLFGLLIGSVPSIMERRSKAGNRYSELEVHLKEYLSQKKTPQGLKGRVMQYMEYRYPDRRLFLWDRIKDGLPRVLRRDLNVQLNQDLINMCYVLSRAQTRELRDVCEHLSQEFAENGLVIIREGTLMKGLYFVRAGQVELTRCGGFVKRLLPGDIFGENALMGHYDGAASLYTAAAVAPTELCFLPIERFEEIVTTHPNLVFTTDTTQWSKARAHITERHEKRSKDHALDVALETIASLKEALIEAVQIQNRQSQVIETWASYLAKGGYYPQTDGSDIVLGASTYQHHSQDQSVQLAAATALHGPNSVSPPPTSASEAASQAMQAALGPTTRRPSSNSVPLAPEEQAQVAAERFERENPAVSSERFERENPAVSSERFERENPAVSSERFERENPAVSSESPALVDGRVEASAGGDRGEGQESTSARVIESNAESFRKSDDDIDPGH